MESPWAGSGRWGRYAYPDAIRSRLSQHSLLSAAFRVGAHLTATLLALGRAVALARFLPVEALGVYALAGSLVASTACLGSLGMTAALLHRAPHSRDEERAVAVH